MDRVKTFKESSFRENALEGLLFVFIAFPFLPWWIASKRTGQLSSALSILVVALSVVSLGLFGIVSSYVRSDWALLPMLGWFYAAFLAMTSKI